MLWKYDKITALLQTLMRFRDTFLLISGTCHNLYLKLRCQSLPASKPILNKKKIYITSSCSFSNISQQNMRNSWNYLSHAWWFDVELQYQFYTYWVLLRVDWHLIIVFSFCNMFYHDTNYLLFCLYTLIKYSRTTSIY